VRGPDALTLRHGDQPPRPLRLDDVLVLTRSNAESRAVAAGLRARGIPCALLLAEYLLATDEARAVADLLAALAAPSDRSARVRAWRTPFFALSWAEARAALDVPEHHPLVARLQAWVELARRRDFPRLFHTIISDSGLATRALGLGAGARSLVNVRHVLELLLEELDRAPIDVAELERRLRRWIADGEQGRLDDSDVQRAETDEPAVRIMTTHRAKGLEAGVVFVFGGTTTPPAGDPVVTIADATTTRRSQLRSSLKEDDDDRAAFERANTHEDERLGYVALTRAKVRTYLPWHAEVSAKSAYAPIQRALDHWLRAPVGAAQPTLPASIVVRPLPQASPPAPLEVASIAAAVDWPAPPHVGGVPAVALAQRGGALLSYSRLAGRDAPDDAIALELAPPRALDEPEPPAIELGPDDLPAGAASGLCVHEVLEHADLELVRRHLADGPADAAGLAWRATREVAASVQAAMVRHGVPPAAFDAVAAMAWRTLAEAPSLGDQAGTTRALAHASALWRELEFAYPLPAAPGAPADATASLVRGVLDALVVWDDAMWIVDYKTDLLASPDPLLARRMVEDRYRTQVALYGLAGERLRAQWASAAQAPRFAGLLYWFVRDQLVVPVAASPANLAAWRQWLAQQGPR
jgi:exodeoxyribonuclease V beta subunit